MLTIQALKQVAPPHPARYTEALLPLMARHLIGCARILDPFGGVGGVFKLAAWLPGAQIEAVELEPEWAAADTRVTVGNALALPAGAAPMTDAEAAALWRKEGEPYPGFAG